MISLLRKTRLPAALPILLLAFGATPARAEEQDGQIWATTTLSLPVADRLELTGGFIVRASALREGIYQLHFTADLERAVGDGVSVSLGYSHIPAYRAGALVRTENRVRQQVTFPLARLGGGRLGARLRLEQRWRDDGENVKFRLRPAVTFSLPIARQTSLRLSHESFFNLNETDWGPATGYDRVRHQVSVRHNLGGGLRGEVGYLNQYVFGGDDPEETDHVLTVGLAVEL